MEDKARQLRESVKRLQKEYNQAIKELANYEKSCRHEYEETIYDPIYTPAHTIPGDPPGTMGVDWQGPVFVSAKTEPRWKRICKKCGLEQITTRSKDEIKKIPDFGRYS
ncbi:hypothetical protein A3K73_08060 [Candidatus Pacearchaeota archaeon RBG_13_36_9]|nr:MAG: hypothetical protein A3K73_08060 [Candidatus Pacearchaeota archaeon RBG_13_36_9]